MADPSLYLFDGYNLLHAGPYSDRRELVDTLASFVATLGARGIVVFDGGGDNEQVGPLAVRFAPDADTMLERLAAENRTRERVLLVSSDATVLPRPDARSRTSALRRSSAICAPQELRPRRPAASATSSTRRPAPSSKACAAASRYRCTRVHCKRGLCFRTVLARFTST